MHRGTHFTEDTAKRYCVDAGLKPYEIYDHDGPTFVLIQGAQVGLVTYKAEDVAAFVARKTGKEPPSIEPYLTKFQRCRLKQRASRALAKLFAEKTG